MICSHAREERTEKRLGKPAASKHRPHTRVHECGWEILVFPLNCALPDELENRSRRYIHHINVSQILTVAFSHLSERGGLKEANRESRGIGRDAQYVVAHIRVKVRPERVPTFDTFDCIANTSNGRRVLSSIVLVAPTKESYKEAILVR